MADDEALVRPEIWAVVRRYYDAGDWDKAIFDALKKVESLTQHQVGSTLIGNGLFELVFDTSYGHRVVISQDSRDIGSLVKLFSGAVGIYKGDRSHGDEPAIKLNSREECLRVLVVASALLDILDRDEARAPSIVGVNRPEPRTLELRVDRLTPTVQILIDGQSAQITWRTASVVQVELARGVVGRLSIVPIDGSIKGKAFSYSALERLPSGENWHRVERVNIDVYSSRNLTTPLMVKAVLIRSCESGHQFVRAFPTRASYAVGDYLTWDWDFTASVGEAWMRVDSQPQLAWGGSTYFAGQVRGHAGRVERGSIQVRPSRPILRKGHRLPLRVIAHYTDSVGDWLVDETRHASIESDNETVALVTTTTAPALVAKADGTAGIIGQIKACHSRAEARVAASFKGRVTEFLGGYQKISKLAAFPGGILVTNQGDTIYQLRPDMGFEPFIRVDMPESAAYGVDYLASADNGDVYYRAIWDSPNTIRKRLASSSYTTEERTLLPSGLSPMHMSWSAQTGAIIADHLGGLWSWPGGVSAPRHWATMRSPGCMDILRVSSGVVVLLNTNVVTELDFDGKTVTEISLSDLQGKGVSAITRVSDSYFIACFNSGEVYEWKDGSLSLIASGFSSPTSLYPLADDRLLVANFSGDSVSEISI